MISYRVKIKSPWHYTAKKQAIISTEKCNIFEQNFRGKIAKKKLKKKLVQKSDKNSLKNEKREAERTERLFNHQKPKSLINIGFRK